MKLELGLADENFKLCYSNYYMDNAKQILGNRNLEVTLARNHWGAFQLVLLADEDCAYNIGTHPWFSQNEFSQNVRIEVLSKIPVLISHIGMMPVSQGALYADVLLKTQVVECERKVPNSIYFEIDTGKEINIKQFDIGINLYHSKEFGDEKLIDKLTVKVNIIDFLMPETKDYVMHLDLWQHLSNISRATETELWSNEHFNYIEEYISTLALLGQKAITIITTEAPWSGQGCAKVHVQKHNMFEYSMIKVEKDKNGVFQYDFGTVKRYIDICFKYGIDKEIELFGLMGIWQIEGIGYEKIAKNYPEAVRIRYKDYDGTFKYMSESDEICDFIKAVEQFFIKNNLIDIVRVVADEPGNMDVYKESLTLIKKTAPLFKFKAALNHASFAEEFANDVEDYVPYYNLYKCKYDFFKEFKRNNPHKRLCFYVCWEPEHPNTLLDNNLLDANYIGALTYILGADGFLRWNYTAWTQNPRQNILYSWFPAGDINFVYPNQDGTPLLSLRYKALKRGIEDFEILKIAEKKNNLKAIDEFLKTICSDFDNKNELLSSPVVNSNGYIKARNKLITELSQ